MARQKRNRALSLAVLALGFGGAAPGLAAVTPSGDTTVAASSSQRTTVGNSGIGTLGIDGGSSLSDSDGYLGYSAGSSGTVVVSGTGSAWTNSSDLYVGSFGGSGTLRIESGGQVSSSYGSLGYLNGSAGTATVSGAGSTWTNSDSLYVGSYGDGTLRIEAGGQVSSSEGHLSYIAGSSGTVTVRGTGSKWTSGNLYVGNSGSGTLRIEAGGQVSSSNGYLGYNTGSVGTATVSGAGSKWTNRDDLYVGYEDPYGGNDFNGHGTLTVADGGLVSARTLFASLGDLYGNGTITANGAVLDADLVFDSTHGMTQMLTFGSGGTLNLTVDGLDGQETSRLGAGYRGSGSLRIADGVVVTSTGGYLGISCGSNGTATVSGAGSKWASGSLRVGHSGSGTLRIESGGQVSSYYSYVGYNAGSAGAATVTGAGSTWVNSSSLIVGSGTLTIEAGGQVSSSDGFLSYKTGSSGTATVRGTGSKWTSGNLHVGMIGSSGTLSIEGGGQVSSSNGYVGDYTSSAGTATVSGAGSKWTNSGRLYVGNKTGSGRLTVVDGGLVSAKTLCASLGDLYGNGTITAHGAVLDADLVFDSTHGTTQTLAFGSDGTLNLMVDGTGALGAGHTGSGSLRIADGVVVASAGGNLGSYRYSAGTASVIGAGSKWVNSGSLDIGSYGGSGTLSIEAGGEISSYDGYLGSFAGSTGTAIVSGAGSKWTSSGLRVGHSSGSGTLTVADRGRIAAKNLSINNKSAVRLHVSGDDMLVLGDALTNGSHLSDGVWSSFTPSLLTYDANGIASFTVSSFSGYAVTAAVPEPGMIGLIALVGAALLARRRA